MFLLHNPPAAAPLLAQALIAACRLPGGWSDPLQPRLLARLFEGLLDVAVDPMAPVSLTPEALAPQLPSPQARRELVDWMVLLEMVCRPIPPALQASVDRWAAALGVEDPALVVARDLTAGAQVRATADFYRLNWIGEHRSEEPGFAPLLERYGPRAYALTVEPDPAEAARWRALAQLPPGSLGRALADFYAARGFGWPGELGAANADLAHHDWVHLIAGYDTVPIGELEVTAFMAAASRDPGAMVGFLGAVSIYETGLLASVVVPPTLTHTLSAPGAVERVLAAIRRGDRCAVDPLLGVDYFQLAPEPLEEVRRAWGL